MNKKLAKISKAQLEIKERGILNFWIFVEYEEGGCQGIGGLHWISMMKPNNLVWELHMDVK